MQKSGINIALVDFANGAEVRRVLLIPPYEDACILALNIYYVKFRQYKFLISNYDN